MIAKAFKELLGKVCAHEYEVYQDGNLARICGTVYGRWYDLRCTKCGKMKRTKLKA